LATIDQTNIALRRAWETITRHKAVEALSLRKGKTQMQKQVRFWHYYNGAVKIKLNVGETVRHSHGGPTDEGYSWEAVQYSFDGETVICEWASQARDCDGRYDRNGVTHCAVAKLTAGCADPDESTIIYPAWEQGESRQRDHSAEAMNY
jgi:hypothetical protein